MIPRWFALFLVLLPLAASADDIGLIRVGQTWKYWKGVSEPLGNALDWTQSAYNDSVWPSSISGFSTLSGSAYEATLLSDFGSTYQTLYFRKTFAVNNLEIIRWLALRIDYDDGFVAYLNGVEVARRSLAPDAGSPPPVTALALRHRRGPTEEIDLSAFVGLLRQGDNVLAVQLHNAQGDFGFCFATELLGNFIRGPFVQNAGMDHMLVAWKTAVPSTSKVRFGLSPENAAELLVSDLVTNHVVTIPNLQPGTTYFYQVESSAGADAARGGWETFRTLAAPSAPISFSVIGDSGYGGLPQLQVAQVLASTKPDFVIHVGDVIYPAFSRFLSDFRCFSIYSDLMRRTPFFFAPGNHDSYGGTADYDEAFYMPTNNFNASERFYSFDHGPAHFVILNSDLEARADYSPGSVQYNWLEADLAATQQPWKLIFFHHVFRSSSFHEFDDYDRNFAYDSDQLQNSIGVLATRYGAQVIINGHDHVYERFMPVNGITSLTTGGGGANLYGLSTLNRHSAQFFIRYHCLKVTIDGDQLETQAIDNNGLLLDSMSISRSLPQAAVYQSAWNTPVIETGPANDLDGNITGQRLDFAGQPIPTRVGQFSNLGRFWVNNDRDNLYVGIDRASASAGSSVFVFVENPKQPGVPGMANLGNGVVDPDGQGADGLDFLENLRFANFAPSVGCVLGDEYADQTFRSFFRPGGTFNAGQGVFRLDSALTTVAGVRLQQFNRSPQLAPFTGEQNADFMEMAIPLSALGNLAPGDTVRIGAVVGLGGVDTSPLAQSRELDTAALGRSFNGGGSGPATLEGVTVKLAPDPDDALFKVRVSRGLDGKIELKWKTEPGQRYAVQFTDSFAAGFKDVAAPSTATDAVMTYQDSSGPAGATRFYRIRIEP